MAGPLARDPEGNIIVLVGNLVLPFFGGARPVTLLHRFSPEGRDLGQFGETGLAPSDHVSVLHVGSQGEIYLAGLSSASGASAQRLFVKKFSRSGAPLFTVYPDVANPTYQVLAMVLGTDGNPLLLIRVPSLGAPLPGALLLRLHAGDGHILSTVPFGAGRNTVTQAMTADKQGNIYLTGWTGSAAFPTTPGAYLEGWPASACGSSTPEAGEYPCAIGFVTKLDPSLNRIVYSTLLGGSGWTFPAAIAVDAAGSAYITGVVPSSPPSDAFPTTTESLQPQMPPRGPAGQTQGAFWLPAVAPFVARLSPDGGRLLASTYLGGTNSEGANFLGLDPQGNVYVAGVTFSRDFPATGPFAVPCGPDRGTNLNTSSFVTKLDPDLRRLLSSAVLPFADIGSLPRIDSDAAVFLNLPRYGRTPLVRLDMDRRENVSIACTVSGATYLPETAIAPGELLTLFGQGLGPGDLIATEPDSHGRFPTEAAGRRLLFDGLPAPILALTSTQMNVVVPYGVARSVFPRMELWVNDALAYSRTIDRVDTRPVPLLRFTDQGRLVEADSAWLADALNEDGSRNDADNPAAPGSWITVFATGLGALIPEVTDGGIGGDPGSQPQLPFVIELEDSRVLTPEVSTVRGRTNGVLQLGFVVPELVSSRLRFRIRAAEQGSSGGPFRFFLCVR